MLYRKLGRTGADVSAVSLGTEYLLDVSPEPVTRIIHEAIDRGVNYFDLFYAQAAFRDKMGRAFRGRRHDVMLTAHLGAVERQGQPARSRDPRECERFFLDYLKRFGTDYTDVLFLHNCDTQDDYETTMDRLLPLARHLQSRGQARFIGFSGHTVATSRQAVLSGEIDVLMFPVNLVSNTVPGKQDLLQECVARDVSLVAMKPYAGGRLLSEETMLSLHFGLTGGEDREVERSERVTPVQCLDYVLAQPGVSTAVPGCGDLNELSQALAWVDADNAEKDFSRALADLGESQVGECVYCNHCLPCPAEINIGRVLRLLDTARATSSERLKKTYPSLRTSPAECTECGACTDRCPFGVDVIPRMQEACELFDPVP